MVKREEIIEALKSIMDPELNMDIVTLDMVRDVAVSNSGVKVTIALTTDACPLANRIKVDSERAIRGIKGVKEVDVRLGVMDEEERGRLIAKLKARGGPSQLPGKLPRKGIGKIIAVLSGKGGVGKSSIASLLAVEISRRGKKVGVLDADITGPSIPKMFGDMVAPFVMEGKIIPGASKHGIKVISMNLLTGEEEAPVIWRGPLISNAIRQFYTDVDWGELDYLVIDLPPGTSDAQLTVMQLLPVDGAVVVTSPQELATMIVSKAINMSQMMAVPVMGVLENMSYIKCDRCGNVMRPFGESKARLLAEKINSKFLGPLPIDPRLSAAADSGKIEDYESQEFKAIADRILS
jgi:ATP-binding protein involved in chromosome partitioning